MGKIINNPEFQHLIENIFLNLKYEDLKKCEMLNKSANQILTKLNCQKCNNLQYSGIMIHLTSTIPTNGLFRGLAVHLKIPFVMK